MRHPSLGSDPRGPVTARERVATSSSRVDSSGVTVGLQQLSRNRPRPRGVMPAGQCLERPQFVVEHDRCPICGERSHRTRTGTSCNWPSKGYGCLLGKLAASPARSTPKSGGDAAVAPRPRSTGPGAKGRINQRTARRTAMSGPPRPPTCRGLQRHQRRVSHGL